MIREAFFMPIFSKMHVSDDINLQQLKESYYKSLGYCRVKVGLVIANTHLSLWEK